MERRIMIKILTILAVLFTVQTMKAQTLPPCLVATICPDSLFSPTHHDISQGRTWLDPEYDNSEMIVTWGNGVGAIYTARINKDGTVIESTVRLMTTGLEKANVTSQPDFGTFAGGVVNSFSIAGKGYMALRKGDEWPRVQLVDKNTAATDFRFVWPSASPKDSSYFFHYLRNNEYRLGKVISFTTGDIEDWGSLGFKNNDNLPGFGNQALASPRFLPDCRRIVSPISTAPSETGGTLEIRLYEIPNARPDNGILKYAVLKVPTFDEVDATTCADWPGKVVLVSRSADGLSWELRLIDPLLPVSEIDGQELPIVQRISYPDPDIWGTQMTNSEPLRIGDKSFQMFITKEMPGGINHIWIAQMGEGKSWVRKVDDIPRGGNGMIITDPEWSGGGEVITAYDKAGKLYSFPTGISVSPCTTTAVTSNATPTSLSVFPNPFSNRIQLKNTSGLENYELYNSMGQIIWKGKNIEQQDFSFLQNGLYFLNVSNQNGQQYIKLMKE